VTGKTMLTKGEKPPLDAVQLTSIRSNKIPSNRGLFQLWSG